MAIVKTNSQNYSSIANAIRAKGVSGTFYPSEMSTAISNIPSGSSVIPKSGVVFIDYDGTVVEAWDSSDVASKTALPSNPTGHTRLVAEGWNWTLAKIKTYMTNHPKAVMTVGQTYHTASGKTELDITVTKVTGLEVTCDISGTKDWGDGTTNTSSSHTYTNYGNYTIKCSGTTISTSVFDATSSNINRFWCTAAYIASGVTSIGASAFFYCYSLALVTIPYGVTSISSNVFGDCYSLVSVTIPDSVTSFSNSVFSGGRSLTSVTIPDSVTSFSNSVFRNCYSLASVTIPDSITKILDRTFENCYSFTSVTIPKSVTSIGVSAFSGCYCIIKYDFSTATAVPTLANTDAFYNINRICKIIVPDALYNSWKAATNWSTYADYIYKASEVTD